MHADTHIPALSFEVVDLAGDRGVVLKQDAGGALHRVELHEMHVALLARRLGIVPSVTAEAASMISASFGQATKFAAEHAALQRAIRQLSGMADDLFNAIQAKHNLGHEDLEPEILLALGLSNFIGFLCEGFEDQADTADAKPVAPQPSNATGDLFAEGGSNG